MCHFLAEDLWEKQLLAYEQKQSVLLIQQLGSPWGKQIIIPTADSFWTILKSSHEVFLHYKATDGSYEVILLLFYSLLGSWWSKVVQWAAALSRSLLGCRKLLWLSKSNQIRTWVPSYQNFVINACCSGKVNLVNHDNILKKGQFIFTQYADNGVWVVCIDEWGHSSLHSPQRSPHRLFSVLFALILWLSVCVFLSLYPAEEHWWKLLRLICSYETFYLTLLMSHI